jgi:Calcineurin-like phosphoesterase
MIRELLHPSFLRAQLERVERHAIGALKSDHYKEMYDDLDNAAARQPSVAVPGKPPSVAYLARNPKVSIFQSVLQHCADTRSDQPVRKLAPGESPVAEWALGEGDLFREFGPCDPRWIECKLAEGIELLHRRPAFPDRPADPVEIADRAQVIVVGDWGTGLPQAVKVAAKMREVIEQGRAQAIEQHVIHLGDTYYSGWKEEYEQRFLPHWPVAANEGDVRSWTLNGNHDMYSGGHGYFGFILRDPRFAAQRGSSHFSIHNAGWQIVALDSAYEEGKLAGHQADWVAQLVTGSPRKTVLLTHHQPFSQYETVPSGLEAAIKQALGGERVEAWLWGHEHRCAVYARDLRDYAGFTSIVGHGGIPVLAPASTPRGVSWQFSSSYECDDDHWTLCGFAVLDLDGPDLQIRYIDENGGLNHTEKL